MTTSNGNDGILLEILVGVLVKRAKQATLFDIKEIGEIYLAFPNCNRCARSNAGYDPVNIRATTQKDNVVFCSTRMALRGP